MGKEQHKENSLRSAKRLFGTIVSPRKAFSEIARQPDIKGPLLLLALVALLSLGTFIAQGSKLIIVTPTPEADSWTEPHAHPLWNSNGEISFNETNAVVGNTSITLSIAQNNVLWANLTNIGQFNCTLGRYEVFSFYSKLAVADGASPEKAKLTLKSVNDGKFELDIENFIGDSAHDWVYFNFDVGSGNENFSVIGNAEWANITGMEFLLLWDDPVLNASLAFDAIYFGEYSLLSSTPLFEITVPSFTILVIFDFFLKWLLFSAGHWLALRSFTSDRPSFQSLFYTAGYCFSGVLVFVAARFLLFIVTPSFRVFDMSLAVTGSLLFAVIAFNVWPVLLGAFALKEGRDTTTKKAFLLSLLAYFVYLFITMGFVFGMSLDRALFGLP